MTSPTRAGVAAFPLTTLQVVALAYVLVVAVASFLPSQELMALIPGHRSKNSLSRDLERLAPLAGALLITFLVALRLLAARLRSERGLWLSGPLSLAICLGATAAVLLVSVYLADDWRELLGDLVPERLARLGRYVSGDHVAAYAGLGCALVLAWRRPSRALALGLGVLVLSALVEALQDYVPGRAAQWSDLLSNAVGLLIGMSLGGFVNALAGPDVARRERPLRRPG